MRAKAGRNGRLGGGRARGCDISVRASSRFLVEQTLSARVLFGLVAALVGCGSAPLGAGDDSGSAGTGGERAGGSGGEAGSAATGGARGAAGESGAPGDGGAVDGAQPPPGTGGAGADGAGSGGGGAGSTGAGGAGGGAAGARGAGGFGGSFACGETSCVRGESFCYRYRQVGGGTGGASPPPDAARPPEPGTCVALGSCTDCTCFCQSCSGGGPLTTASCSCSGTPITSVSCTIGLP
jgi:hypothetical protein